MGKSRSSLQPMKPGLHGGEARLHLVQRLPWLAPAFRARKHLLYAVCSVHSADGQSRWLQVRQRQGQGQGHKWVGGEGGRQQPQRGGAPVLTILAAACPAHTKGNSM